MTEENIQKKRDWRALAGVTIVFFACLAFLTWAYLQPSPLRVEGNLLMARIGNCSETRVLIVNTADTQIDEITVSFKQPPDVKICCPGGCDGTCDWNYCDKKFSLAAHSATEISCSFLPSNDSSQVVRDVLVEASAPNVKVAKTIISIGVVP